MAELSDDGMTGPGLPKVAGIILCGGAGKRLGGEKALLPFAQGTLLDAVLERVLPQVSNLALNVSRGSAEIYRARYSDHPLLFDASPDRVGPLAGVIAGLEWARTLSNVGWLATFPCDTPFLPRDLVARFTAGARDAPVFAHDGYRQHGICAIWPLNCVERLRHGVEEGHLRSVQSAMRALEARTCVFEAEAHAFFNINTRADLARAEELARATP